MDIAGSSDIIVNALGGNQMGLDVMDKLRELWRSDSLDQEDRDMVWRWLDLFFNIAQKYKTKYGSVPGWE